ncbi:MAG: tetratricopeptide repeat protein [Deltaproteobacteria bacterium]|nr:tetratricopeptide repeat protein [Deltaproteobacteria bacterium]
MGHIFQIRNHIRIYLILVFALLIWLAPDQTPWASVQYLYEKKDEAEEKKRYVIKMEQDIDKCEMAIANTKTLIARSKNRPYLPEIYLRLAELYIEKSRLVYFLRRSQQEEEGERALDQYESNMLKQQALEVYKRILTEHPNFEYIDKVRFFMAHEYRELGQIKEMLQEYERIIVQYPNSQYAPEAHLLLGDYYFTHKQDIDQSRLHYEAVLKYPQSPAVSAARYKLAWCEINLVDYEKAIKLFEESVTSSQTRKELDIDTYRHVDVRLESLTDMAYCYPEVYKKATPEQALAYFKQYSWSRPVYTTVLEKLAYRYYVKKQWMMAAAIYRELAKIRQDPEKLMEYAKHIFESAQAIGSYEHAEEDVGIIIQALERQKYSVHVAEEDKVKMISDFEIYARDLITHLHAKARESHSARDFLTASNAYKQYLRFFEESPSHEEMAVNFAEALFSANRYMDAAKQYEKVTQPATVNNKDRKEMLYSAVVSYYQALKSKDELNFYQTAYARDGLQTTGKTYANEYPDSTRTPDVLFNVAWVTYDAGHYETAIAEFSSFVDHYTEHQAAKAAVHLVMDAYHQLEDYDGLISYGRSILGDNRIQDNSLRAEVAQIVRSAESKVVSNITMAVLDDWDSARQELMQVADQGGNKMGEEALNALILSSKDQKDLPTLYDAGCRLVRDYPESPSAKETLGILIGTSIHIGQFRLLADYLEQFVQRYPKNENSGDFLSQAAQIREGLGQYEQANKIYQRLLSQESIKQKELDNVVFAMVDNARELGNNDAALSILDTYQSRISTSGKVRVYAQMAVLNLQTDRLAQWEKFGKMAQQAYKPQLGADDPALLDLMAEIAYNHVYSNSGPYYDLQLEESIDNKIVEQKAKMLETLENGYQKVIAYKSPTWALKACFRAGEINREFADFLINSPVPAELSVTEGQEYRKLITERAQAYLDKAAQYLKTCVEIGQKWEICDPRLAGYFNPAENPQGRENQFASLAGGQASTEIAAQGLRDQALAGLYERLLKTPDDRQLQLALAEGYMQQGDFRQASLIAKNVLPKLSGDQGQIKARLLNVLGLAHLYCGHDSLAKESFRRALDADDRLDEARVKLAGIYRHYGHHEKAAALMENRSIRNVDREEVHSNMGVGYNEYAVQQTR